MDWYLLLIDKYGYLAILVGTLVEGEIFLTLGGVFARQGVMSMTGVVLMAIGGSFASHTLFYFLGRWRGLSLIQRFPRLEAGYPRAHVLAQKFGPPCILVVQFLYGMRLVTCLTLGILRLRMGAFIFWQLLSCTVWALIMALGGYLCGAAVEYCLTNRRLWALITVVVILVVLGLYRLFWSWTEKQVSGASPATTPEKPGPAAGEDCRRVPPLEKSLP